VVEGADLLPLLALVLAAAPNLGAPSSAATSAVEEAALPEVGIPFGCGLNFLVSQAHDTGSHTQHDTWAWDFRMPDGVPIVSALDGVVRMARGDSTRGGCDPKFAADSNYVVVQHDQGYETQYLHFQSVVVKAGDRVRKGDLLGYSGRTGWACGSHLHFKVTRTGGRGWNNPSVRAVLAGHGDPQVDAPIQAPRCPTGPMMASGDKPVAPALAKPVEGASLPASGVVGASSALPQAAGGARGPQVAPASAKAPARKAPEAPKADAAM
jgi:murein DD-endopeptidase MepM/ murein hydrolase activator NlpD